MKIKTTQKEIKTTYSTIIKAGYCRLQFLLSYQTPQAYTAGKDGWSADIYDINDIAISTGYAPFGNVAPSYEILKKYDNKAAQILSDQTLDYLEKEKRIKALLSQFIKEVTE